MNTFISPLYIQTNAASLERIVFGLLGVSGQTVFFHASEHKVQIAEQLLGTSVIKLVKSSLSSIRQVINQHNAEVKAAAKQLFNPNVSAFNWTYVSSLSTYSNGLIQFGEPLPVAGEFGKNVFVGLFERFVGEPYIPLATGKGAFARLVKTKLNVEGLAQKADINYAIKPSQLNGLFKPMTITLMTTHDTIEVIQQIDFTNTEVVVANHLYEYEAVADILNDRAEQVFDKPGTFKIVAEAPLAHTPQREQYDTIKNNKQADFTLITPEELAHEAQQIAANGHMKASILFG